MDLAKEEPQSAPRTIHLRDYQPPAYRVETLDLHFELDPKRTRVRALLVVERSAGDQDTPFHLDGHSLHTLSIHLDGEPLHADRYILDAERLDILAPPARFTLETVVEIEPDANTALEGLYVSSGMFCTQCEAEGFRRITWFPDRPDVMARFTSTLVADRTHFPVLLSNGNPVDQGELDDGRHWVKWEDPFPKPCYLFALVAGRLVCQEDRFVTASGREVALRIYVEPANAHKCDHALASLKQAMRWDEQTYGREYDLDIFMIVAVDDFNMGAMENKGLNIFNSACVLVSPDSATDGDYYNVQSIVGHEYFHNWSGNRVTCRDWFQLSLKEGFTVYRDQEFSADLNSRPVKRISDVNVLRNHQFAQDAGPMAHPVRPDSYMEISNFYTVTVYNKGADVVRMIAHLLGPEGFRKGCDLYFERHDGQAVTTDDFVRAMEDVSGVDLGQFRRWYEQAGTPRLGVRSEYDARTREYRLTLEQSCPATPGQPHKKPFHIPVAMALLDTEGNILARQVLELRDDTETFHFPDLAAAPVPSLLCEFSAPVKLAVERSDPELAFLFGHDPDPFNRWDAGQQLALNQLLRLITSLEQKQPLQLPEDFVTAYRATLTHPDLDPALIAQALSLPAESYIADQCTLVNPQAIHEARQFMRRELAQGLKDELLAGYLANQDDTPYVFSAETMGRRALKNLCLGYLMELEEPGPLEHCLQQFRAGHNMTDVLAALGMLADYDLPERAEALNQFYDQWQQDPLVVDKWFGIQAGSRLEDTLGHVQALMRLPAFKLTNPNKVRALIGRFCAGNPARFHAADGSGYAFLADQVLALDEINPQMAARMVASLSRWRQYEPGRRALMQAQLERIQRAPQLSRDVYEIVNKSLVD
ncbi:MAG: aminopeptidase N [Gammaproteobacteria bacterium]|nr:aminopeptidase N [Gammaproteobacteria bacterium]